MDQTHQFIARPSNTDTMNKFNTFFIGFLLALHLTFLLVASDRADQANQRGGGGSEAYNSTNSTNSSSSGGSGSGGGATTTVAATGAAESVRSAAVLLLPAVLAAFLFYGRR
ncbi:hypothetical protein CRUP_024368 [Coryphaenoides rupestris]|nr:hypothetical protein CRUP_024368 [Coryphaenoides rupestris]